MLADKINFWTENEAHAYCVRQHAIAMDNGRTEDAWRLYRCCNALSPRQALTELWDAAYADKMRASMRAIWDEDRDAPR